MSISNTDNDIIQEIDVEFKSPKLWKIIIHNDNYTPMDFVVAVLKQIFNKNAEEATSLMMTVHNSGKALVGTYTKEVAETKVLMVTSAATTYEFPLLTTMEQE